MAEVFRGVVTVTVMLLAWHPWAREALGNWRLIILPVLIYQTIWYVRDGIRLHRNSRDVRRRTEELKRKSAALRLGLYLSKADPEDN